MPKPTTNDYYLSLRLPRPLYRAVRKAAREQRLGASAWVRLRLQDAVQAAEQRDA